MILADTHCHLDLHHFDADRESVIQRASEAGLTRILIPTINLETAGSVLDLTRKHGILYAAVGIHPTHVASLPAGWLEALRGLTSAPKVVAIGEVGLDYYWITEDRLRSQQRDALRMQLQLAAEASLPVVLHLREAGDAEDGPCAAALMELLEEWVADLREQGSRLLGRAGVLHSFGGSLATARRAIELGLYIGITGPVTFPRAERRRQLVRDLPGDKLLIETDAPFLAPQKYRGRRNEPAFVADIADRIAEVQSRTAEDVAHQTSANAARLFGWGEFG